MGKHLFISGGDVKREEKSAGYTITFDGRKAYVRTTHKGIIAVLQVLDQLKRGAK